MLVQLIDKLIIWPKYNESITWFLKGGIYCFKLKLKSIEYVVQNMNITFLISEREMFQLYVNKHNAELQQTAPGTKDMDHNTHRMAK